jgi:hypothetical protein
MRPDGIVVATLALYDDLGFTGPRLFASERSRWREPDDQSTNDTFWNFLRVKLD